MKNQEEDEEKASLLDHPEVEGAVKDERKEAWLLDHPKDAVGDETETTSLLDRPEDAVGDEEEEAAQAVRELGAQAPVEEGTKHGSQCPTKGTKRSK